MKGGLRDVKRRLAALACMLVLVGCASAPGSVAPVRKDVDKSVPAPPVETPTPVPAAPVNPAPPVPEPPKAPATPPVNWYPRGIGLPLTTDDQEAKAKKVVMLTFDDGPHEKVTPLILDILKKEQVPALFFVTGYGARHQELILRIHNEGHVIGTHTKNHDNLTKLSKAEMHAVIEPVNRTIEELTGRKVHYFRPPYGAYNPTVLTVMKEMNLELINWSIGSLDWHDVDSKGHKDPARIVQDVMDQLHPGGVVLFHDTHMHTAEALPKVIKAIREAGYEFVVMQPPTH